tara:strand:- start:4791 stop:5429 length:639 start_codon:yes stop_codon:yes gene_type:complete
MKYFRLSLIIIALFNYQYIKAENVDEYKIEIVLFKFNKVLTDELFDINLNEPDLNETIEFYDNEIKINKSKYSKFENISTYIKTIVENEFDKSNIQHPSIWYRDSDDLKILKKFNNNIGRNNDLKLLGHHSWIQNIPEYDESKYLRFKNTDYGFYLKLYKKRFLHLDLKTFIKDERNSDIQIFIDKEHRIFNEEIYFFDHPAFGILFTINKI